jgi:protein TonB
MPLAVRSAALFDPRFQLRAVLACLGISVAVHAVALATLSGLTGGVSKHGEPPVLTATIASRSAPEVAPAVPREADSSPPRPKEKPKTRPVRVSPPTPQNATPAAAPAPSPAPEQTASSAPANEPAAMQTTAVATQGEPSGKTIPDDGKIIRDYRNGLMDYARRFRRYPAQAMERGWEGRVEIRVTVRPDGMIESAVVKTPSGYQILDDQALDMVKRAQTRTPIPPALRGREFTVDIPVSFELQG